MLQDPCSTRVCEVLRGNLFQTGQGEVWQSTVPRSCAAETEIVLPRSASCLFLYRQPRCFGFRATAGPRQSLEYLNTARLSLSFHEHKPSQFLQSPKITPPFGREQHPSCTFYTCFPTFWRRRSHRQSSVLETSAPPETRHLRLRSFQCIPCTNASLSDLPLTTRPGHPARISLFQTAPS